MTHNIQEDIQSLTGQDSGPSDLLLKFALALSKELEHGTSGDAFQSKLFYVFMILDIPGGLILNLSGYS